eukprot:CAMPEP_0118688402 /NCGR_PEP_ID=MMETSP0800-20121206/8901_1 /TAXON_ID=210618 ORGANISM="Striatella unipunctata, Strain CCMP2910" /NCGR_SAMPLE_ID=MMETSP0800 /ASSEMBLY_ACC=CAM_ASM_000638 /LENGTH=632 /DNA_ID=CAMNT_0006585659 /DNA_START=53 /DNA_END=1952 /DNA_ORIENTATION=+
MRLIILFITFVAPRCNAFVCNAGKGPGCSVNGWNTRLHAFAPLIIGPLLRKLRDPDDSKGPMVTENELAAEAPGLRVGAGAWKWPSVWPFEEDMFKRKDEIPNQQINDMVSMLSGTPQLPVPSEVEEQENALDLEKYWMEEKGDATTDMEPAAIASLQRHFEYYLREGMSIVEFGAAEKSYLPEGMEMKRHVGLSLQKNPALSERYVVDFNKVNEGEGIESDTIQELGVNQFDAVVMTNTIDFLTSPREVFRTAWSLLRPGGIMLVPFSNKELYTSQFSKAQTSMWVNMNDDQHMWICGSFFQFSAGNGWDDLKAFDISPEGAKAPDANSLVAGLALARPQNLYVVQATKGYQVDSISLANPEGSFQSLMWMLPTMEERDKTLIAPRLARAYLMMDEWGNRDALVANVETLPRIYESLLKMDQFAFTFSMQAQLAADLVVDEDFNANDAQLEALSMGLGLTTPSEEFWVHVGKNTANMQPGDKINLLAYLVPRFGSGNPEQEKCLQTFISGMQPTFDVIRSKCPTLSDGDVELIGTELLAAEVLKPGVSSRGEYASWLNALTESDIVDYLGQRRSYQAYAESDLQEFRDTRTQEAERVEQLKKMMEEQQAKARKDRSMIFNPRTGNFEGFSP